MNRKKVISVLCAMLLAGNLAGCASQKPSQTLNSQNAEIPSLYDIAVEYEDPFAPVRKDIQFTQIENIRYENMEEFKEKISGLELLCEQAGTFEEIKELYAWLYQEYMKIDTAANVSQVEYHLNMLNEELAEKSLHNQAARSEAYILYEEAIRTVLASPYAQEFSDFIGEDVARQFGGDVSRDAEKLAALMIREGELIKEYEAISMQDNFTVEYDGKTWNLDTLIREQDKMTEEQYSAISDAIIIQKERAGAELYLQLVEIRKEVAELNGYDSPVDYYYEKIYSRDYSPQEAKEFHAAVKEYVVPVCFRIAGKIENPDATVAMEDILPIMETYLPRISSEMADLLDYMVEHDMYALTNNSEESFDGGYTMTLSGYGQPYVYNAVYGGYSDITGTIHEFGHYCDLYLNGIYGVGAPEGKIDVAEISSIGLELLFYEYFEEIFDGDASDEKINLLSRTLANVVTGCMYDEFQQRVYEYEGELTVETVNELYAKTVEEYGMGRPEEYAWVDMQHNFNAPFYYISYGVASTAALEIWMTGENEGYDAAREMYLEILSRGAFEYDYFEIIEACGMQEFKDEKFLNEMGETVIREIEEIAVPTK